MEFALIMSGLVAGAAWLTLPVAGPLEVELKPRARVERAAAKPVIVSIAESGEVFLSSRVVTKAQLRAHLAAIDANDRVVTRVFVRAHPRLAHGKTMAVMQLIAGEGFANIALVPGGSGAAVERGFVTAPRQDN